MKAGKAASLHAVADWHVDRAMYFYRSANRAKNYDEIHDLLDQYGRHMVIADRLRSEAHACHR